MIIMKVIRDSELNLSQVLINIYLQIIIFKKISIH